MGYLLCGSGDSLNKFRLKLQKNFEYMESISLVQGLLRVGPGQGLEQLRAIYSKNVELINLTLGTQFPEVNDGTMLPEFRCRANELFGLPCGIGGSSSPGASSQGDLVGALESGVSKEMEMQLMGLGDPVVSHASEILAPDHEGIYRSFSPDEPVWEGARVVRNEQVYSEDVSAVYPSYGASGVTRTLIPSRGEDGEDITEIEFEDGNSSARLLLYPRPAPFLCMSFKARAVDTPTTINLQAGNAQSSLVDLSLEWQWFSISGDGSGEVYVRTIASGSENIYITKMQVEGVPAIDSPPSEYIKTEAAPVQKTFSTTNGNSVLDNVVTEGDGVPLAPPPRMKSQQEATNNINWSKNLTEWAESGVDVVALNEVGLDGVPDSVCTLTDDNASGYEFVTSSTIVPADVFITLKAWIKKDDVDTRFPCIDFSGSHGVFLNTKTGDIIARSGQTPDRGFIVIDSGDWWIVIYSSTNTSATPRVFPAGSSNWDGNLGTSAVGLCIVGNVELHNDKTIDQVKNLGPIFTESTAVSTDKTVYQYNELNIVNSAGGLYLEVETDTSQLICGSFLSYGLGAELVVNGAFNENVDDWVLSGNSFTWNPLEAGDLNAASSAGSYQAFATEVGKEYTAKGETLFAITTHAIRISDGAAPSTAIVSTPIVDVPTKHIATFTAIGTTSNIYMRHSEVGTTTWDNMSVRELFANQNFSLQDTSANIASMPGVEGVVNKVGLRWSKDLSLMSINVNGAWSGDEPYGGSLGDLEIFKDQVAPGTIRNIKTHSGDYETLKELVDQDIGDSYILVPALDALGANNPGYSAGALGSMSPLDLEGLEIKTFGSFGQNWLRVDLGFEGKEIFGSTLRVAIGTEWVTLDESGPDYSYGGFFANVRDLLAQNIGLPLEVRFEV